MKKYAMLIMNSKFTSQQVQINTDDIEHHIICVSSVSDAKEKVIELVNKGFGAIEICGAFGEEEAKRLYEAADERIPIGYVIYPENQLDAIAAFWDSKI